MQAEGTAKRYLAGLEIRFTEKAATGWGGLSLVAEYFRRIGLRELLGAALPDGRTSPNQCSVVDMAMAMMVNVLMGGARFAHVERLRSDEVLRTVFEIKRMPSAATLTRYFGGFVRKQSERLAELFERYTVELLGSAKEEVLDLDSTVFDRYGEQEGSHKGYHPRRPGRPSHHPILAMLAGAKVILHSWLRSGEANPMRGCVEFLRETLARLPETFVVKKVRADSGFFCDVFLSELEERNMFYAVAVRARPDIQKMVLRITEWRSGRDGRHEFGEFFYGPSPNKKARRIVVVRQPVRKDRTTPGKLLFQLPKTFVYQLIVTNMSIEREQVWEFYNGRADCENRIKELKHDFAAGGFCLQSFFGTEACFRLVCLLFNLMAILSARLLGNPARRLSTIRSDVFVAGAILGRHGRDAVLRIAVRARTREQFQARIDKLGQCLFSTASQLLQTLSSLQLDPSRRWKPRSRPGRLIVVGGFPPVLIPVIN